MPMGWPGPSATRASRRTRSWRGSSRGCREPGREASPRRRGLPGGRRQGARPQRRSQGGERRYSAPPPPSHAGSSAADGLPAVPAELRARAEVRAALGALPRHRREGLTAVAAELSGARRAAVRAGRSARRHRRRSRGRPLLLTLLEGLRHPEPDTEPRALQRRAAATLPALRHALRRPEHRLALRVLLKAPGELAVGGVLGQTLQGRLVLVLDGDGEVAHPDDGEPVAVHVRL